MAAHRGRAGVAAADFGAHRRHGQDQVRGGCLSQSGELRRDRPRLSVGLRSRGRDSRTTAPPRRPAGVLRQRHPHPRLVRLPVVAWSLFARLSSPLQQPGGAIVLVRARAPQGEGAGTHGARFPSHLLLGRRGLRHALAHERLLLSARTTAGHRNPAGEGQGQPHAARHRLCAQARCEVRPRQASRGVERTREQGRRWPVTSRRDRLIALVLLCGCSRSSQPPRPTSWAQPSAGSCANRYARAWARWPPRCPWPLGKPARAWTPCGRASPTPSKPEKTTWSPPQAARPTGRDRKVSDQWNRDRDAMFGPQTMPNNLGDVCKPWIRSDASPHRTALRLVQPDLSTRDYSFDEIDSLSSQFANVLTQIGQDSGKVISILLPKCVEVFASFLGTLKAKSTALPLFSNFGDLAIVDRLSDCGASCIVARRASLPRLLRIRASLPALRTILLVDGDADDGPDVLSLPARLGNAPTSFEPRTVADDTPSLIHYTSGSTGKPKGVVHVHGAAEHIERTMHEIMQVHRDDVYWCTADHGWITGTSYGIIGPWLLGVTQVHFAGSFDPERWFQILQDQRVSVWYTAPTALRMLARAV